MILALASGGNGAGARGRLLAVDAFVSGKLVGAAGQGPLAEVFHVTYVSRDEGRRIVDAGDANALLVPPAGLQEALVGEGTP